MLLLLAACLTQSEPAPTRAVAHAPASSALEAAPAGEGPRRSPGPREEAPGASALSLAAPAAPASPPPAPYNLADDRTRIIQEAKRDLGRGTITAVADDVFVLIGAPGWGQNELGASLDLTKSALAAYFNGRFRTRPSHALAVYLFPNAPPYRRYCRAKWNEECISVFGFYHPDERKLVMNAGPGLGTLTHELVHPIVEADFPDAPTWINEGIASLYEAPVVYAPGEIRGVKNWRHPRLLHAIASPKERSSVRLDALFGMPDDTFRGDDEDLHYAMARYACQWLDQKKLLWPFYQRWRDTFANDHDGEKAFTDVVGRSPMDATSDWVKWVSLL
jgi:hypothetical protein